MSTVVYQENHGLLQNDIVSLSVTPGISTTYYVKYNDTSKRVIINPRNFGGAEINTTTDTINIPDHGYETGDKILYISSNVATPLTTDTVYFVVRNDSNS